MIREGMIVRTSYGTGPYKVLEVTHGCTCPSFLDSINLGKDAPPSKPHYHLVCRKVGGENKKSHFYLNGYDENYNCVWDTPPMVDRLIVCEEETLFLNMCCNF